MHSTSRATPTLEAVFAKAQIAGGISMLVGSVAGGFIAQATNLGVPYIIRAVFLILTFGVAFFMMHDIGFHSGCIDRTDPRSEAGDARIRGQRMEESTRSMDHAVRPVHDGDHGLCVLCHAAVLA